MTEYRLILVTDKESKTYAKAKIGQGLDISLEYLYQNPLAREQRWTGRARYDHVHLSVACASTKLLVQWWGRASDGYHHPIGRVMKMIRVSP
jgi:hypothetical protein